jgi:hypothetical protein
MRDREHFACDTDGRYGHMLSKHTSLASPSPDPALVTHLAPAFLYPLPLVCIATPMFRQAAIKRKVSTQCLGGGFRYLVLHAIAPQYKRYLVGRPWYL